MNPLVKALEDLLEVKNHKDIAGKDAWYNSNQPKAWQQAREALSLYSQSKPKVICYCGSLRVALEAFKKAEYDAVIRGEIALLPCCMFVDIQREYGAESDYKQKADELHKRKIDICDEVFVLNVGGYIGESTRNEINYALKINKPIKYLEPLNQSSQSKEGEDLDDEFRMILSHAFLGSDTDISKETFDLAISECVKYVLSKENEGKQAVWVKAKNHFPQKEDSYNFRKPNKGQWFRFSLFVVPHAINKEVWIEEQWEWLDESIQSGERGEVERLKGEIEFLESEIGRLGGFIYKPK